MFTEVKSIYRLYGPPMYINKMQELVDSLVAAGHSSYLAKQLAITKLSGGRGFYKELRARKTRGLYVRKLVD